MVEAPVALVGVHPDQFGHCGGDLYTVNQGGYLQDMPPWLRAIVIGGGYSALIRLKFTTLPINGENTPVGIDTVYEGLKSLIHKRINRIIREWRMERAGGLAQSVLDDLKQQAKLLVISDALMTDAQRREADSWIDELTTTRGIPDSDRRLMLAIFILTGQRRPHK